MGFLLAAFLGGFLLFNGAASPGKAAHLMQESLQKQYPTAQIKVDVEGKHGMSLLKGNFKKVHVEMENATISDLPFSGAFTPNEHTKLARAGEIEIELNHLTWGTLPVERARFDFTEVRYDFNALKKTSDFQMAKMGPSQMQLRLSTDALRPAFASRLKDIQDLAIDIEGDQFKLTGSKDVVGLATPVELDAHLIGVENTLRLEDYKLSLGGVVLPGLATNALVKDVNPIYSFDKEGKWPFRVQLSAVNAHEGKLDLTAKLVLK
jgi:hypothetical protein